MLCEIGTLNLKLFQIIQFYLSYGSLVLHSIFHHQNTVQKKIHLVRSQLGN